MTEYSISIGVARFKDQDIPSSDSSFKGAQRFHDCAADRGITNRRLLVADPLNPHPTTAEINAKIQEFIDGVAQDREEERRLLFYFSSHGQSPTATDLTVYASDTTIKRKLTGICSKNWIDCLMGSGVFTEVFFFFDACRTKANSTGHITCGSHACWTDDSDAISDCVVYYATGRGQSSVVPPTQETSFFTQSLLHLLSPSNQSKHKPGEFFNELKVMTVDLASAAGGFQEPDWVFFQNDRNSLI